MAPMSYGEIHEIVVFIATELDETSAGFSHLSPSPLVA